MKMKHTTSKTIPIGMAGISSSVLLLSLALNCSPTQAQAEPLRYEAQPGGGKVKIEGTSSIHEWSMESPVIGGFLEPMLASPNPRLKGGAAKPKVEVFHSGAQPQELQQAHG